MAAEIQDGAFLVARAIFNSSLWTMRNEDRILAITLIGLANWRARKWFDGENTVVIERGELVRSLEDLAEAARLTLQETRTSLRRLEKVGFLTRKPTRRYTHLTLCKYDHYQTLEKYSDTVSNTPLTRDQHAPNNPLTRGQHDPNNKQVLHELEEFKKGEEGGAAPSLPPVTETSPKDEAARHITRVAIETQKSPNNPETLGRGIRAMVARHGGERVLAWHMDPANVGKGTLEMQDELNGPKARPGEVFKPAKTACANCGGTGRIAGGVKDGAIVQIPCSRCAPKLRAVT